MKIIYQQGEFYKFVELPALFEAVGPQGLVEELTIPKAGDLIQHPHDSMGYQHGWLPKIKNALPEGLTLDEGGGLDNDVYKVIETPE